MKRILMLLTVLTVIISCNKAGKNEYIVSGTVKGIADGKTVVLEKQDEMGQFIPMDTVKVKDGKFMMKGSAKEPEIMLIQVEAIQGKVPFVLENGNIDIIVDKDSLQKSKFSGTFNNDVFSKFNDDLTKFQKELQKKLMTFQNANMAKMKAAEQAKDTIVINKLMKEYQGMQKEGMEFYIKFAEVNPKALLSALIVDSMLNDPTLDVARAKKIYASFSPELKNYKPGKSIKTKLDKIGKPVTVAAAANVGSVAPDFTAKNPEGKSISLKQSLGKVTIVDFWASWCKPCRVENPNVVALYAKYHFKGLNILSVSLDKEASAWKDAIAKDNLTWNHVSNLKEFEDPIALQYGINAIPTVFVLDAKGIIIAKDIRGEELNAKIASLLGSK
ncbi:MAG: TlpA disulfide reductase family protein [Flavobacterium sp.]|jgi:thiol-disulfide isomerase/thioredoxin|nr:TlpA disulfide reductase family protein [Flavobacterium sp.]